MSKIVGGEFLLGDVEKEILRKQLWKVAGFCGVEVLTYCIMDNHFHVLLRTPDANDVESLSDDALLRRARLVYAGDKVDFIKEMLGSDDRKLAESHRLSLRRRMGDVSQFMKELKQRFSIWYNRSRPKRRSGTLWAERFKSVLVEDCGFALATVAAYIDLNPVRAGMVQDPAAYRFCGYGEAMGGSRAARAGLRGVFQGNLSFARALEKYRVVVFGKGYSGDASHPERMLDGESARSVVASGGKVSREVALRCRVRYFTDGAVVGSEGFVQRYFEDHRNEFSKRRRDGPRVMRGADWQGLRTIRDLRNEVIS